MYDLPDFDDAQRLAFLALDESELALAFSLQEPAMVVFAGWLAALPDMR